MCDYSLTAFRSRLAVEGEELMVYRFPTGCLGLVSPRDPDVSQREFAGWPIRFEPSEFPCAVCIPHGARLVLRDIPDRLQRQLGVGTEEIVMFIQMSGRYHDGIRFANGQELSLQRLVERQRADVLSLSLATVSEEETDAIEVISSAIDWLTLG
jgi:hypothetical protein